MCEECVKHEARVKGDAAIEKEKSAGSSGLTEGKRTTRTGVTEMDAPSHSSRGELEDRITAKAAQEENAT